MRARPVFVFFVGASAAAVLLNCSTEPEKCTGVAISVSAGTTGSINE